MPWAKSIRAALQPVSLRSDRRICFSSEQYFRGKKSKTIGFKIDQGVADNKRSAVGGVIKNNLAGHGAIHCDDMQLIGNLVTVCYLSKTGRRFIRKGFGTGDE